MTAQASGSAVLARQGGPATSSAKAAVLAEDTDGSEYAGSISGDGTAASGLRRCSRCRAHKDVSQFKVKVAATGPSYASCNKCSVR